MYWGIYDDYTIRTYKPKSNKAILIRALEPSYKDNGCPYRVKYLNNFQAVLELYFDDIRDAVIIDKYKDRFTLFNTDMANKLYQFVINQDFDEVIIHCNAGISRSSALMICFSKIINRPDLENAIINCGMYLPNQLIIDEFNKLNIEHKDYTGTLTCTKDLSKYSNLNLDITYHENDKISLKLI